MAKIGHQPSSRSIRCPRRHTGAGDIRLPTELTELASTAPSGYDDQTPIDKVTDVGNGAALDEFRVVEGQIKRVFHRYAQEDLVHGTRRQQLSHEPCSGCQAHLLADKVANAGTKVGHMCSTMPRRCKLTVVYDRMMIPWARRADFALTCILKATECGPDCVMPSGAASPSGACTLRNYRLIGKLLPLGLRSQIHLTLSGKFGFRCQLSAGCGLLEILVDRGHFDSPKTLHCPSAHRRILSIRLWGLTWGRRSPWFI